MCPWPPPAHKPEIRESINDLLIAYKVGGTLHLVSWSGAWTFPLLSPALLVSLPAPYSCKCKLVQMWWVTWGWGPDLGYLFMPLTCALWSCSGSVWLGHFDLMVNSCRAHPTLGLSGSNWTRIRTECFGCMHSSHPMVERVCSLWGLTNMPRAVSPRWCGNWPLKDKFIGAQGEDSIRGAKNNVRRHRGPELHGEWWTALWSWCKIHRAWVEFCGPKPANYYVKYKRHKRSSVCPQESHNFLEKNVPLYN